MGLPQAAALSTAFGGPKTVPKAAARFYGPYLIVKKIGKVAYKLQLPKSAKIHLVFHVSQLKGAIGGQPASPELPAHLTKELELNLEPEAILGVRTLHEEEGHRLEVLVKWRNVQEFDAT